MKNNLRIIALAAALLPFAGCSSSTSPDNVSAALTMGAVVQTLEPFKSSMDGNSVTVLGAISTPTPCYNFNASVTVTGNVVEATVKADAKGGGCVTAINRQSYTLVVNGVPNGTWVVRVMHQQDGKTPLLEYETNVTIK